MMGRVCVDKDEEKEKDEKVSYVGTWGYSMARFFCSVFMRQLAWASAAYSVGNGQRSERKRAPKLL